MCLLVVQWVCWGRAGALRSLLSSFKLRSLHGLALDSVSVGQGCRQEPCLMHEQFSRCVPHRAGLTDTNTSVILTRLSCYLCSLHTARERQGRSSRNLVPSPPFGYQTEQCAPKKSILPFHTRRRLAWCPGDRGHQLHNLQATLVVDESGDSTDQSVTGELGLFMPSMFTSPRCLYLKAQASLAPLICSPAPCGHLEYPVTHPLRPGLLYLSWL